jgi:SHS2 domain-containing protein
MTEAMTTAAAVEPRAAYELSLESPELDLLLVDWLSELLFRFETRDWLVSRAAVEILSGDVHRLGARIEGETLDPARHPMKVLLKAVTYHGLEVRQQGELWTAQIIFDL